MDISIHEALASLDGMEAATTDALKISIHEALASLDFYKSVGLGLHFDFDPRGSCEPRLPLTGG